MQGRLAPVLLAVRSLVIKKEDSRTRQGRTREMRRCSRRSERMSRQRHQRKSHRREHDMHVRGHGKGLQKTALG